MTQFEFNAGDGTVKPLVNCNVSPEHGKGTVFITLNGENDLGLSQNGLFCVEDGTSSRAYYLRPQQDRPILVESGWLMGWATERDGVLTITGASEDQVRITSWFGEVYLVLLDLIYEKKNPDLQDGEFARIFCDRLNALVERRVLEWRDDKLGNCTSLVSDWLRLKRLAGEHVGYVQEKKTGGGNG